MGQYLGFSKHRAETLARKAAREAERAKMAAEEETIWLELLAEEAAKRRTVPPLPKVPKAPKDKDRKLKEEMVQLFAETRQRFDGYYDFQAKALLKPMRGYHRPEWYIKFVAECRLDGYGMLWPRSVEAMVRRMMRQLNDMTNIRDKNEVLDIGVENALYYDSRRAQVRAIARRVIRESFSPEDVQELREYWAKIRRHRVSEGWKKAGPGTEGD